MKNFLLTMLLLWAYSAFSQDSISSIEICYSVGGYPFNNPGVYSTSEYLVLKPGNSGDFTFKKFEKVSTSLLRDGVTSAQDTVLRDVARIKPVGAEVLYSWLKQLNTPLPGSPAVFIKPHVQQPTMRQIKRVARQLDMGWKFRRSYYDKDMIASRIESIQQFEKLDVYLAKEMRSADNGVPLVADAYNVMSVKVVAVSGNVYEYRFDFFGLFGQPVQKIVNSEYRKREYYSNLKVLAEARGFLPENSMLYKVVDFNVVTRPYIEWYLTNLDAFEEGK